MNLLNFHEQTLFTSGLGGYALYRIPALLACPGGVLLAFCEARRYTGQDADEIDLLLRRSLDGGATFEAAQCLFSAPGWAFNNPAPLYDRDTGLVWLIFCKNGQHDSEALICRGGAQRTVWAASSSDLGATWSKPREITASVKPAAWAWYATGPCHGIQLASGRLLVPCDHSLLEPGAGGETVYGSHVILSDDHGQTWRLGGLAGLGANECAAAETPAGQVYLNCRNAPGAPLQAAAEDGSYLRAQTWSADGGETFGGLSLALGLPEPVCQASLCSLPAADGRGLLLFSNPAGPLRERLSVRASADGGQTWPVARTLYPGPAAYSDLCALPGQMAGCLYERGASMPYETICFARFNLAWLERAAREDR